ncbi:MAG TPA: phosphoglycerate kinase [Chlamydiales bacterium]|nr:phosphoglycerate kinase [Chlamydiales bacterium]
MKKLTLKDLDLKGKTVLMRVDFNVPLDDNGKISDDSRILESLPSIHYILQKGASLILMSHLGRPKGKKDPKFTLAPCAKRLSELIGIKVKMAKDCIGEPVEKEMKELKPGEVLLLENLRFYAAEEEPDSDPSFAKNLSKLGDVYVNDAFGAAHRKHSSTFTIAKYFPSRAAMGLLMEKELRFLEPLVTSPKKPFFAILGGAKISTKVGAIEKLIPKLDALFLGGAMTYTFLKAEGISIGSSLVEMDHLDTAKKIRKECEKKKIPCYLPVDLVIAKEFKNEAEHKVVLTKDGIPDGWQGMDIGPQTIAEWKKLLPKAKAIFWNGPLGVFEMANFAQGTREVAKILSSTHATTIVGGGDSVAAVNEAGLGDKFTHLSTGGGASLEFLEFGHLPGIDALSDRP